jgi:hypothetical protein
LRFSGAAKIEDNLTEIIHVKVITLKRRVCRSCWPMSGNDDDVIMAAEEKVHPDYKHVSMVLRFSDALSN